MSELIQWPKAKYWTTQCNTVIGCKPCSPACEHCYAAAWAKRFGQSFEPHRTKQKPPRKGVVFCGNMTDLFGEWRMIDDIATDIKGAFSPDPVKRGRAAYLWLTKRVYNMAEALVKVSNTTYWPSCDLPLLFANHYFGFTAENQEWYEKRMSMVNECFPKWANLWISAEPLLGPIDFRWDEVVIKPKVVITGCESGPNRRPCKIEWVESIVEQCRAANVPVFVKQVCLPNGKFTNKIEEFPPHLRIRQVPWAQEGVVK